MKVVFLITVAVLAVHCEETYSTENDDLDIDAVVADLGSLQAFVDCFNDKGGCNPVMSDFKKDLNEVVEQSCKKCTPAQKHILNRFIDGLKKKLPSEYQAFKNKYDPQSKHFAALEVAIANA